MSDTPRGAATAGERQWALDAAKRDATYLISYRARQRALDILSSDESNEADAARIILHDGGAQQGGADRSGMAFSSARMDAWRHAADILGVFEEDE